MFYERGSGMNRYHSYLLFASTLPDGQTIVGTIAPLTVGTPGLENPSMILETNDCDDALQQLVGITEDLGDHQEWMKLSDCPLGE